MYRLGAKPDPDADEATRDAAFERAIRNGDTFQCSCSTFDGLEKLAGLYGWKPIGPQPVGDDDPEPAYIPDSGHIVRTEDAAAMADALEAARFDRDNGADALHSYDWPELAEAVLDAPGLDSATRYRAQAYLEAMAELYRSDSLLDPFIAFARGGAFTLG